MNCYMPFAELLVGDHFTFQQSPASKNKPAVMVKTGSANYQDLKGQVSTMILSQQTFKTWVKLAE